MKLCVLYVSFVFLLICSLEFLAESQQQVTKGQFPFVAQIWTEDPGSSNLVFCGGTILTDLWVLTAAHCLKSGYHSPSSASVSLGVDVDPIGSVTYEVPASDFVFPSDYDGYSFRFNIAFIKLPQALNFTDKINIRPVDFLGSARYGSGVSTIALEWVTKTEGLDKSKTLGYAQVDTITNEECFEHYGSFVEFYILCAGGPRNGESCEKYVGNPLIELTEEGNSILVGVSSFYPEACNASEPYAFIRISDVFEVIKNVTDFKDIDQDQDNGNAGMTVFSYKSMIALLCCLVIVLVQFL